MKRRAFLLAIPLLVAFGAGAQPPPGKTVRVGLILTTSPVGEMLGPKPVHPRVRDFLNEMHRLGYVEGRNFIFERRSVEGKPEGAGNRDHDPALDSSARRPGDRMIKRRAF